MNLSVSFKSSYRGQAHYIIREGKEEYRVIHYFWTPEQYQEDFKHGGWNYTQEEWEQEVVTKSGKIYYYLGGLVNEEVKKAIHSFYQ